MDADGSKFLLPYYGSAEDEEKIVQYLKTKPTGASEKDLSSTLGASYADPRKYDFYDALGLFSRADGKFRLSDAGLKYLASDSAKRREIICSAIRAFRPYHAVLEWAFHNNLDVLDADQVRHRWAQQFKNEIDFTNKYRLTAAPTAFFVICQMAGLGSYLVGRRGAKSRLELDNAAVELFLNGAASGGGVATDHQPKPSEEPTADTGTDSNSIGGTDDQTPKKRAHTSDFTFNIPVFGRVARIVWDSPTMTGKEWEKLKKVGDAMFLDDV